MGSIARMLVVLACPFLFSCCYTYQAVPREMFGELLRCSESPVRIATTDDVEIRLEPDHYVAVSTPANIIYGVGKLYDRGKNDVEFRGSVRGKTIDSGTTQLHIDSYLANTIKWYDYPHPAGGKVRFLEGDFVAIDSSSGPGIYYCGRDQTYGRFSIFGGRILPDSIKTLEVKKISVPLTAVAVLGAGASAALLYFASQFKPGKGWTP